MNAQCIMVCSGKGGTGKSTVSVLLGACLARLGRKTLLVELDSGLRSVDIIAGVYGRTVYDIEDVLCGRCEGAKAVVPSPLYPGLSVILSLIHIWSSSARWVLASTLLFSDAYSVSTALYSRRLAAYCTAGESSVSFHVASASSASCKAAAGVLST